MCLDFKFSSCRALNISPKTKVQVMLTQVHISGDFPRFCNIRLFGETLRSNKKSGLLLTVSGLLQYVVGNWAAACQSSCLWCCPWF